MGTDQIEVSTVINNALFCFFLTTCCLSDFLLHATSQQNITKDTEEAILEFITTYFLAAAKAISDEPASSP